jgi:hypothetical protein
MMRLMVSITSSVQHIAGSTAKHGWQYHTVVQPQAAEQPQALYQSTHIKAVPPPHPRYL